MKRSAFLLLALVGSLSVAAPPGVSTPTAGQAYEAPPRGAPPLLGFAPNRGQADERVQFVARGPGWRVALAGAHVELSSGEAHLRLRFEGGRASSVGESRRPLPGAVSYLRGADPSGWVTGLPTFREVVFGGVYPGVDVAYTLDGGRFHYDLLVAPGSDPASVAMTFEGADQIELGPTGDLCLHTSAGTVRQAPPVVYQDVLLGERRPVPGAYVVSSDGRVTFRVGPYDPDRTLVIDPTVSFLTYLGGGGGDDATACDLDPAGNLYVVGGTSSEDFPVLQPIQKEMNWYVDGFVLKIAPDPPRIVYATFLGGTGVDLATCVAADGSGCAYVTGRTESADFPVANAAQPRSGGMRDAFVAKLDPTGTALVYSTYLGGVRADYGKGLAVDREGNAYVTGKTNSEDFPTVDPFQADLRGEMSAYLTRLDAAGRILYSTFLGGTGGADGCGVAVDGHGCPYVVGSTTSPDFPAEPRGAMPVPGVKSVGFVTSFDATGQDVLYSFLLSDALPHDVVVGADGSVYVAGIAGPGFPGGLASSEITYGGGVSDGFVMKLPASESTPAYLALVGGSDLDRLGELEVDSAGNVYFAGYTTSDDFPVTPNAHQSTRAGDNEGALCVLDPTGGTILYATFLGGTGSDLIKGVAVRAPGEVWVVGQGDSRDLATVAPLQAAPGASYEVYIAHFTQLVSLRARGFPHASPAPLPSGGEPGILARARTDADAADPVVVMLRSRPKGEMAGRH